MTHLDSPPRRSPGPRPTNEPASAAVPTVSAWSGPVLLVVIVSGLAVAGDFVDATTGAQLRLVAGAVVVAALVWGSRHHGAVAAGAWLLVAVGICGWVVGDGVWDLLDTHNFPDTSRWYDVVNLLYTGMYPVLFVALVRLVRAPGHPRRTDNVADSAIMALTVALLLEILVLNPRMAPHSGIDWASALYPLGDALLLAPIAWLVFTRARRNPAWWIIAGGMLLLIGVDAVWETALQPPFGSVDQWTNPLYPISYALIGAAVLHPAAAHFSDVGPSAASALRPVRVAFLCAALSMIPVATFFGAPNDVLVQLCITALVAAIAVRFATLVRGIHHAHQQAEDDAARFANLAAAAPVAILETDADLTLVFANEEADRLLGGSVVGRSSPEVFADLVDERDLPGLHQEVARVLGGEASSAQIRILGPTEGRRWVTFSAVPIRRRPGPFEGAFVSVMDITPIKEAEEMLCLQATQDPLTGLPNRRMLMDRMATAIAQLDAMPGRLAVLFVDLDGFKEVNDRFGHDVGDEVLSCVSQRIVDTVRSGDVVARLGGDEFVVLIERVRRRLDAVAAAEKIIDSLRTPLLLPQGVVDISVCIGVALACDPTSAPEALLHDADQAMYAAKRCGHGVVRVFEDPARPSEGPRPPGTP